MLFPILVWYGIFHYGPLYGILIAFKDFSPIRGIWGSRMGRVRIFQIFVFPIAGLSQNTEKHGDH